MIPMSLFWVLIAFIAGSLPISVWIGKLALKTDIRRFGDGNPGAANVWRAGGRRWGLTAVLLDFLKGAVPVFFAAHVAGLDGWSLALVATAPVLGHAFSPFLGWRGGKALAVTFGIWSGLTIWLVPTVLGALFGFWLFLIDVEGWAVVLGLGCLLLFLLLIQAEPAMLLAWSGNSAILAWKHRQDLRKRPYFRFQRRS